MSSSVTTSSALPPSPEYVAEIIRRLHAAYPDAACELVHDDPLQLLVATILSAQCTDERVNKVTPALFAAYPTAEAFAEADIEELEEAVRSTGFYRNKAKNIQGAARRMVAEYDSQVPENMDDLLTLPGVARKTANVVLGVGYEIADGVVVDTHVKRLSNRLGLTQESTPEKIERDLMAIVPQDEWIEFSHLLIFHGRRVCKARKPDCAHCTLADLCPSAMLGE
ncbi:MAG: endonuclease III [Caldilineaceae bacterium]|nr:endonuclease III [Caldilineaceae bacterium]